MKQKEGKEGDGIDEKLVNALERVSHAFKVLLHDSSKSIGISPIQAQIILFLAQHNRDRATISNLAIENDLTKATISESVKTLMKKGLVIKEGSKIDSRSFSLTLTASGEEIYRQLSTYSLPIGATILDIPDADKTNLYQSVLNILKQLNQSGLINVQRMCQTCKFYKVEEDGRHYCKLLEQPLLTAELRLDCPEHILQE